MDFLEKVCDWLIWLLVLSGIGWFVFGCYTVFKLAYLRG